MRLVSDDWWTSDTALLTRLGEAIADARAVPAEFIAAGKAVWVPPDLDAELARLIYDSQNEPAAVRADIAGLRALTFASATQTVELEVVEGRLLGQVIPPERVVIGIEVRDGKTACAGVEAGAGAGAAAEAEADELGYFVIPFVPAGAFRLRYRTPAGTDVVTSWADI